MCSIPHVRRISGRYVYRRRLHFRKIISKPLSVALRTADPSVARARAALLSVRFLAAKAKVERMLESGPPLTGEQIEALFRHALEKELQGLLSDAYANAPWSDSVPDVAASIAAACRELRRPNRPISPITSDRGADPDPDELAHLDGAAFYAAQIVANLGSEQVAALLKTMQMPVTGANLEVARTHLIRGMGAGAKLAQRAFDDDVLDAANPIRTLTADLGLAPLPQASPPKPTGPSMNAATSASIPPDCPFIGYDPRPFSEVIENILANLKLEGIWKGGVSQQRRIMQTFAWITGDKPLGAYSHLDVAKFKNGLLKLPKNFRFGSPTAGAMSRPFDDVLAELNGLKDTDRRHVKTLNRDLSTMQTVSRYLEKSSWKARISDALVLNFGKSRNKVKRGKENPRPPWRKEHLACLFNAPLYTGCDGALHRLKHDGPRLGVWHDAAYWAPLIWFYTAACREEICGLEIQDVILDHPTPHFHIRDNLTRGRDGEKAGEKTDSRNRLLPIPSEVLRLGFANYVGAIAGEGHVALFPELYCNEEKRGGGFFYDRAWRHMVAYIGDRMPLPEAVNGKGADIHSIRSLGSSFYEVDGVNDILRADVMGHSRQGTNAVSYSQREKTEGEEVILAERLAFMNRYVPVITEHLRAAPINLLPLAQRSRTGSPRERKQRSEIGSAKG